MEIRTLEHTGLDVLCKTFNEAFAGYFVPFRVDEDYLFNRWKGARVDYRLSVGVFGDDGHPVAFMVFGIDDLDGKRTGHNAATGVVPGHRGNRWVEKMYDYILPRLREAGVTQSTLEVITLNEKAIRAYANVGYHIHRNLLCFKGKITVDLALPDGFYIEKTKQIPWEKLQELTVYPSTWEMSETAIRTVADEYTFWALYEGETLVAFAVVNLSNGFVGKFGFREGGEAVLHGRYLMSELGREFEEVKINNVDASAADVERLLLSAGLANHISQYEMRMDL